MRQFFSLLKYLMVTYKASAFLCLYTSLVDIIFPVAFYTVIHFHAVPRIFLQSGNVGPPYVPAVSGDPVLLVRLQTLRLANRAMAFDTFHSGFLYMRSMGKEHAGWLP
jgi:hypothetical protein